MNKQHEGCRFQLVHQDPAPYWWCQSCSTLCIHILALMSLHFVRIREGATSKHLHFNVTNASLEAEKRALYYLEIKCMPAPYKYSFPVRLLVAFDSWEWIGIIQSYSYWCFSGWSPCGMQRKTVLIMSRVLFFFPIRQSYDAQFHLLIKYIIGVIQSYGLAEKSQEVWRIWMLMRKLRTRPVQHRNNRISSSDDYHLFAFVQEACAILQQPIG